MCTIGTTGSVVALPLGNATTSATRSTFQLSPPIPPLKWVPIVTPRRSLTRGAVAGSVSSAMWVWPFPHCRLALMFFVSVVPPAYVSVTSALSSPPRRSSPPVWIQIWTSVARASVSCRAGGTARSSVWTLPVKRIFGEPSARTQIVVVDPLGTGSGQHVSSLSER